MLAEVAEESALGPEEGRAAQLLAGLPDGGKWEEGQENEGEEGDMEGDAEGDVTGP